MSRHVRTLTAISALVVAAACSPASSPDEALLRDLEQAEAASIELAPRASGTQVVSAIESSPNRATAKASQSTSKRSTTPQRAPVVKRPAPEPSLAQAPEPTPEPDPAPSEQAISDSPAPTATIDNPTIGRQPTRKGRYKTTAEVIRNAPFPILP